MKKKIDIFIFYFSTKAPITKKKLKVYFYITLIDLQIFVLAS